MLLALLVVALSFVVGLTYLSTSTTTVSTATLLRDHAQSRQIAESGVDIAAAFIEQTPGWRSSQPQGAWIQNFPLTGGTLDIQASFPAELPAAALQPTNASFETAAASLATPLLNPPMSGTMNGWTVTRTALAATGLTVPTIGVQTTTHATHGTLAGFISFQAAVTGSGTFSQSFAHTLSPRTRYELAVDVTVSTALSNLTHELRVRAGSTLVASSSNAWTLSLPAMPSQLPTVPQNPTAPVAFDALLTWAGVGPGTPTRYTLSFVTDDNPPAGNISIDLSAQATGLLASVWFDNVSFTATSNEPLMITATGRCGSASHVVTAQIVRRFDGHGRIVYWKEP